MRVLPEAVLARGDWPLFCDKLAISHTFSYAKNRNDPRTITLSKVPFPEVGFSAVAILGGGWLQSPASDGPPCTWNVRFDSRLNFVLLSQLFIFHVINGLKRSRALWRSEARRIVIWSRPCTRLQLVPPTPRAGSPSQSQPCVPLIFTMHRQPFSIPVIMKVDLQFHFQSWNLFFYQIYLRSFCTIFSQTRCL